MSFFSFSAIRIRLEMKPFGGTRVRTQGLALARWALYHFIHTPSPEDGFDPCLRPSLWQVLWRDVL
jgi:hypothetical protein